MKTDLFAVHLYNDFSGSPRVLSDLLGSLPDSSGNRYIFTSHHNGFLSSVNCKRINVFYGRSSVRVIQLCFYLLAQIHLAILLAFYLTKSVMKKRKRTVVINTMLPFAGGLIGRLFASSTVYYVHESCITPSILKRFLRAVISLCATHVIFVSRYLWEAERFKRPKQEVIYNGLRSDFSGVVRVDSNFKYELKQVLFAGSLKAYKGIVELIELAIEARDFNFIAAVNCDNDELERFLKTRSIPSNLTFLARPSNLRDIYARSFCILNLSLPDQWVETFGLSLLEGMAFGCPAVAPPIGGPIEFVSSDCGLLVDARRTQEITCFLNRLNSSFFLWNKYSNAAVEAASAFSYEFYRNSVQRYFCQHKLL